jgi:hypothetical protein
LDAPKNVREKIRAMARVVDTESPLIVVISKANYNAIRAKITCEGLAVLSNETMANVIAASAAAIKEIAKHSRIVLRKEDSSIKSIIDEGIFREICCRYEIGSGLIL